jgi:hypothetical protein
MRLWLLRQRVTEGDEGLTDCLELSNYVQN